MSALIDGKKALLRFYSKWDTYVTAALKFGISFFTLYYICEKMGHMAPMAQIPLLLILAAFGSFLSPNMLLLAGAVYLEGQFFGCSVEAAVTGGILLLLFLLLYFSFIPRQTYVVILTALCISLQVPLAVPVAGALLLGPGACVGMVFGTVVYYMAAYLGQQTGETFGLSEELFQKILSMPGKMFMQEELILTLVILTAVFLVVWLLRRLPVKYSWSIAWISGIVVYGILKIMGTLILGMEFSVVVFAVDVLLGVVTGSLIQFFCFRLDYDNVKHLQFEDDEYYYYVKAVPKLDRPEETDGHVLDPEEEDDYYLD